MAGFSIPEFVSDPPTVLHTGAWAAQRWLWHLGLPSESPGAAIGQLAKALNTSPERIEAVLKEGFFRARLKDELLVFDPVPHETAAREQFVRLATLKQRYTRRFKLPFLRLPAFFPEGTQLDWPDRPGRGYGRLKDKVRLWERTWRSLVARNPALELLERMEEAAQADTWAYACNGWPIGYELAFYEWVTGGTHEPPPLSEHVPDALYRRLCELQPRAGGWWYWKHKAGAIVWVTDAEWKTVAANWTYGRG